MGSSAPALGRYWAPKWIGAGALSGLVAGMLIRGGGQECVQVSGWFQIEQITLDPTHPNPAGSTLKTITVTFEQSCNGESAILRGCLHYEEP